MRTKVFIPGRLASTRFPNKLIQPINGLPVFSWVIRSAVAAVGEQDVIVATEDKVLADLANAENVEAVITGEAKTGTDRVALANDKVKADFVVNVQGDEPFIDPGEIRRVYELISSGAHDVVNCFCSTTERDNLSIPKVVIAPDGRLLYMSRADIPGSKTPATVQPMNKQVCIYGFRREVLEDFASFREKTPLESNEDIEILRFLELGYRVDMLEVKDSIIAIDTLEDLERARLHANP
jgi:3-deoxy-manno-octulosonate cytidylyltransferase (CMP-KDO synthetase)